MKKLLVVILVAFLVVIGGCENKKDYSSTDFTTPSLIVFKSAEFVKLENTCVSALDGSRWETGEDGETLPFSAGQTVLGRVEFNSGKIVNGLIVCSPLGGAVLNGILNPLPEEMEGIIPLSDEFILENPPFLPTLSQLR